MSASDSATRVGEIAISELLAGRVRIPTGAFFNPLKTLHLQVLPHKQLFNVSFLMTSAQGPKYRVGAALQGKRLCWGIAQL